MSIEIERKFMVVSDAWQQAPIQGEPMRYTQGYLSFGEDGAPEIRVRLMAPVNGASQEASAVLTVKGKGDLSRKEIERPIDLEHADELLSMCQGNIIQKVRHQVAEASGLTFEIDVYEGEFAGLCVAEIELPSEDAMFESPSFLGDELTTNKAYKNASLAKNGLPRPHASSKMKF